MRLWTMVVLAIVGWWFLYRFNTFVGRGVGSFFAGGLAYLAYARILLSPRRDRWTAGLVVFSVCMWAIGLYGLSTDWAHLPAAWSNKTRYFPVVLMFPATVVALALLEMRTGKGKRLA